MAESLERLLQSMRSEGLLESTGSFTVDFDRALAQQRGRRLAHPSFFVLKLVQWAVASQASRIEVACSRGSVSVQHDGLLPTVEELSRLLSYTLSNSNEPVRELAVAINTAMGLPAEVSLLCTGPIGGRLLNLIPGKPPRLLGLPPATYRVSRVCVKRSLAWNVFKAPELSLVQERCRWTPALVLLNGKSLADHGRFGTDRTVDPEHHVLELRYHQSAQGQDRFFLLPSSATLIRESFWDPGAPQAQETGSAGYALALALRSGAAEATGREVSLRVVYRGVELERLVLPSPLPGVVGILSASDLRLDLSEFTVVQDEKLKRVAERIEQELARLERLLSSSGETISQSISRILTRERGKESGDAPWHPVRAPDGRYRLSFPGHPLPTRPRSDERHRFGHGNREYCMLVVHFDDGEVRQLERLDLWIYSLERLKLPVSSVVEKSPLTRMARGERFTQTCTLRLQDHNLVLKLVLELSERRILVLQARSTGENPIDRSDPEVRKFFESLTFRA